MGVNVSMTTPDWKKHIREHLPPLGLSGARETEIIEELALQFEQAFNESLASGASRKEAEARATAQIRDWRALAAEIRRAETPIAAVAAERLPADYHFDAQEIRLRKTRRGNAMADFLQDLRYAIRMLRKSPGITAVIILTLALGIGANTAIYSVINAVLFHTLPYQDPAQLVWITDLLPKRSQRIVFDVEYFTWRRQSHAFQDMAAYSPSGDFTLTGAGEPIRVAAGRVTFSFFHVLGAEPRLGRAFSPEEDRPGGARAAILSDTLWRQRFSSDPTIVGKPIALDGNSYTVVGVLAPGFEFLDNGRADLMIPFALNDRPIRAGQGIRFVRVIARLRAGVSLAAATSDLNAVNTILHAEFPGGYAKMVAGSRAEVMPLRDHLVGNTRGPLLILFGAVAFVLLIACANVANLQLARAAAREKELAVRRALGAGRGRVARQLLTESSLLGLFGGAAGLALAFWLVILVRRFGPRDLPHLQNAQLDWRVLAFTLGAALLTGILFGAAPVISTFRSSLNDTLKESGSRKSSGGRARRPQQVVMVAEIALAFVLFVGAGLLARSFVHLVSIPLGFDPHGVLTAEVSLPLAAYPTQQMQHTFAEQLLDRLRALPGVSGVGASAVLPTQGFVMSSAVDVEGRPSVDKFSDAWSATINLVSQGFFETLRIPLLQGRQLDRRDAPGAPLSVVVNQTFARLFFPQDSPIGKRIGFSGQQWWTIVGVVADSKQGLVAEVEPEIFATDQQGAVLHQTVALRTDGDPLRLVPAVRAELTALDKDIPLYGVEAMEEMLAREVAPQRFNAILLGTFAALALLLAVVGIYGVMAYAVGQRTQEIGIRMALGALPGNVQRMVLAQGVRLAVFGVVLGVGAGIALTRLLRTLLFEVKATDPATFAAGAAILFAAALAACWIPARRATRVDPLVALRYE
jgi:putative ABC transport system permease protein